MQQQTAFPHTHQDLELPTTLARILGFLRVDRIPTIFLDCGRIPPQADSASTMEIQNHELWITITRRDLVQLPVKQVQTIWKWNHCLIPCQFDTQHLHWPMQHQKKKKNWTNSYWRKKPFPDFQYKKYISVE